MTSYKDIEAEDLFNLISKKNVLLVDVRNDDEVARGVIPNAAHILLAMLPVQYELLQGNEPIVFYCHSGIRSAQAAAFIASKGRPEVYNLMGGVLAWGRAGYSFAEHQA